MLKQLGETAKVTMEEDLQRGGRRQSKEGQDELQKVVGSGQ